MNTRQITRKDWESYHELKQAYKTRKPFCSTILSHPMYVRMKGILLQDFDTNEVFDAYWSCKQKGQPTQNILAACKDRYERFRPSKAYEFEFQGKIYSWSDFRTMDLDYNSYDHYTKLVILPWKLSKADEEQFREENVIHFVDPYCDGRDCTGAPFTGYMKFLRCSDRTWIIHHVDLDL